MNELKGFQNVPGVPDGLELLEFRKAVSGDCVIDVRGLVMTWSGEESVYVYPIVREIEVPKQYRPFANAFEYVAKRRDGVAVDWKKGETNGFYAIVSANDLFVWVAFGKDVEVFEWQQAFERLAFRHTDGSTSPFGVEVSE